MKIYCVWLYEVFIRVMYLVEVIVEASGWRSVPGTRRTCGFGESRCDGTDVLSKGRIFGEVEKISSGKFFRVLSKGRISGLTGASWGSPG